MIWKIRQNTVSFGRTLLMGILNITPDSFSDGGRYLDPEAAVSQALKLVEEGADILDLGAESTRPGATPVTAKEEWDRLLPVLKRVRKEVFVPISIDTSRAEVAKKCLELGVEIINDVTGLKRSGREMAKAVKDSGAGIVLMHSRSTPGAMQDLTDYRDVVQDVMSELRESVKLALDAGIDREQIVIDPGLGFAKTPEQNLEILKNIKAFHELGFPVLVGPSQKSFIGKITGRETKDRSFGTAACVAVCVRDGVQIVRVHEAGAMRDVVRMTEAIM
ncbi:MAG TPA: dihydropteroate synthase [Candidatus Omnitrophota bacterium]|nr:dihydropteroate synthase [Candidatus Omnitrophota bacterium]HRY84906.1 dihydropteroate synthase [Candidatus Omnitrophota bacterium]